ncbi:MULTISPECIES: alpha/beta fold hydrolase [Phyllobacteriaceae]|jgi:pimeloyl-ACP methyl ester carboxylesterase|uniref:Alpha/beta hydrolase n=1 Tax=Mesorhizobium hungaricum TaxID=1566387 RepID=A0A1C2DIH7_9HYPH|nr:MULTISPECIES: alpha/beta fold hydrolase [Mesorhizobium]MBN9234479.1 alpha/beta fold hydrolase [Mesorhizobium sp.]MDQ0332548.1 pimeloyl-ACP methyl ester carboxylesterase [Mesorhizobium sp. YL-MeA3-2017]OCX14446.1 alpha/beta hydrolase [Mesorhizobium hungaricum]
MQSFSHEGFDLAFLDRQPASGSGDPVLMIHGFASSHYVNWVAPGWFKTLNDAGYRAIAFDHRGHGASTKTYDGADYTPDKMASDAAALLDHLGIERAHVMGYSMGARVSAFLALSEPGKVATLVLGGLGIGLVDGVGDWDPIAEALLADEAAAITHARGRMFRAFADQTKSDREALAACIIGSRDELSEDQVARIAQPTLIAVGTTDDIAGSPDELAALMPNATAFHIEGRDHMLSVGDRTFKKRVLEFYSEHPL